MGRMVTIDGREHEIRPLTRGEIKALRKEGVNLAALDAAAADDAIDRVLALSLGEGAEAVDNLPNPVALDIFRAVMEETYGGGPDEKN